MEPKKNPKADLRGKSFLFFNIGLITALLLAIFAFSFKTIDSPRKIDLPTDTRIIDEPPIIPITSIVTPPPPRIVAPVFIEVKKDEEVDEPIIDIDIEKEPEYDSQQQPVIEIDPPKEESNEPFITVEEGASPSGGYANFYQFIAKKIKYPAQARRLEIEGKVFVEFIVERDGSLTDLRVIKGIGAGCDEEALRVIALASKWNPGKQRGKPVRQKMVIPIHFQVQR